MCVSSGECYVIHVRMGLARDVFEGGASHTTKAATPKTTNKDLLRMCSNNNKSPSLIYQVQLNCHYLREINLAEVFPENMTKIDFSQSIQMTDWIQQTTLSFLFCRHLLILIPLVPNSFELFICEKTEDILTVIRNFDVYMLSRWSVILKY